jgi:hypothetical protein
MKRHQRKGVNRLAKRPTDQKPLVEAKLHIRCVHCHYRTEKDEPATWAQHTTEAHPDKEVDLEVYPYCIKCDVPLEYMRTTGNATPSMDYALHYFSCPQCQRVSRIRTKKKHASKEVVSEIPTQEGANT